MKIRRVLVVGAGSAGVMAVKEMVQNPDAGYLPVAFVDDDPKKKDAVFEGVSVVGGRSEIPQALKSTGADEILIALPSVHGSVIRDTIETCQSEQIQFRIVPGIWEIIRGDVHIDQIRKVEPEDLLGRETVEVDASRQAAAYAGRRVLITGAGGSIGRELARQILPFNPERLVLLGRGENSLFETEMLLPGKDPGCWESALVNLRDHDSVKRLFGEIRPHLVLHAAAHKHVSFMEAYPEEGVLNNIVATRDLVEAAASVGTERFVMLSTDKAVNPRSVMGTTKRVAELFLKERMGKSPDLRLMTVRFGNVLGSRGSVVPLFLHQIRSGGPLTVSHPDVARYFMTLKEAAILVLEAGAMGEGGEIFVLDMGNQIRIMDLARDLITLSGLRPDTDVEIKISGLKPGEKLREDLVYSFEQLVPTQNPKIQSARSKEGEERSVHSGIERLQVMAQKADRKGILGELARLVPEATLPGGAVPAPSSQGGA